MDFKYSFGGIFFVIFGIIIAIFHNHIGESTIKFRENLMNEDYGENVKKVSKIVFLMFGLFFILFGILSVFHLIHLR